MVDSTLTAYSRAARTFVIALLVVMISNFGMHLVVAETQSLIDSTVVVPNLDYYTISRDIDIEGLDNVLIEGTIQVSDGFVSLYVMDSSGYNVFKENGDPRNALYRADNIQSHSLTLAITEGGMYYIVLENNDLFSSKTVQIKLTLSFENPSDTLLGFAIMGTIALVVIVVVVLIFRRVRRRSTPGSAGISGTMSADAFVPKNCIYCGAVMHQMAKTCPACGREQLR